ncbi:carboxypeptidase M32 [Pseudoroseomonas wenyumeiae]|uniref:Metal-dependent carboxypeptidase n=1 Tax=Teichococcus wenyumeiae TaxID=2478470 RepID=A0A3A9JNA7_9PROT|nr:carboxypeptidase M32 [Pseudoroseomonas wenyumeiae]RKK02078.1 carboxypeptidase M32 [Pseudoroseomonas wenyumeiae]RMI26674.1 carboxypeptidase M32 [Pseudoroseomonas wenyumeiae]
MNAAYHRLKARFARITLLGEAQAMLHWDAAAVMPPGGAEARGEQLAALSGLSHELLTAPQVAEDLAEAQAEGEWDSANLDLMRQTHRRATALPTALVEATTRANAACEARWRHARAQSDFALVAPALKEVVRLQRETAAALAEATRLSPYDALMEGYQRGIGASDVEPIFAAYEQFLREALPQAEALQAEALQASRPTPRPLAGPFPVPQQQALCRAMAERVGLDFDHARLDESTHPFCGGTPADVRITTRYSADSVAQALFGVLHETGHALYERGLPAAFARQPVGEAAGMAAHESQSLIIEMQACRSDAFLRFIGPQLQASFGGAAEAYDPANLAALWRRVERGFIRVDADELTYPAHVILRFRLERALIGGELEVEGIPAAWNEGFARLLGLTPPDDARGCLQDIHWYDGAFGYFPSYTLGAMAAAQLMRAAREAEPGLDAALAQGDFTPLRDWLRQAVHGQGSRLGFQDLLRAATGKPLDPSDFTNHLRGRYLNA